MSSIDPREFGQLEAKVDSLEKKVDSLEVKVDKLLTLANKGKGAWWAGLTLVSGISGIVAFFASLIFHK